MDNFKIVQGPDSRLYTLECSVTVEQSVYLSLKIGLKDAQSLGITIQVVRNQITLSCVDSIMPRESTSTYNLSRPTNQLTSELQTGSAKPLSQILSLLYILT